MYIHRERERERDVYVILIDHVSHEGGVAPRSSPDRLRSEAPACREGGEAADARAHTMYTSLSRSLYI